MAALIASFRRNLSAGLIGMLKSLSVLSAAMLLSLCVFAQNLVPNPSFENVNAVVCDPFTAIDFDTCNTDWYTPTLGTPDLFSTTIAQSCWNFQPNSTYPGPIGLKGPQLPRTGDVMAGFFASTIAGFDQREYVQVQLTQALEPCRLYRVSFYVSLADSTEFSTSKIGAHLDTAPQMLGTDNVLVLNPQVEASGVIDDATNWVLVVDTIEATSAFEYLTIGNFYDDANTDTTSNPNSSGKPGTYGAYYFLDDVAVERVCPEVSLGPDQTFCIGDTLRLGIPAGVCYTRFEWSNGDTVNTTLNIMDEGFYSIRMWQDTCVFGDTLFADGLVCPATLDAANVFSPNGDGINDIFKPVYYTRIESYEMKIYDRWGNLMFISNNMDSGWDGKREGNNCPEGVYFYNITFRGVDLKFETRNGNLTLLR